MKNATLTRINGVWTMRVFPIVREIKGKQMSGYSYTAGTLQELRARE